MAFKSLSQARHLYKSNPILAKEFAAKTNWQKLPVKVKPKTHEKVQKTKEKAK
jgi:hypothetical protein